MAPAFAHYAAMASLSLLTQNELSTIGLSSADRSAFIAARVQLGALDSVTAVEQIAKALSPAGAKAFKAFARNPGMVTTQPTPSLNRVALNLKPSPPMVSEPGMRVVIRFRRQVDAEDFELPPQSFTLSGPNLILFSDVSFEHLIHYRILTATGEMVTERVLTPTREQHGELVSLTWSATPPHNPARETLRSLSHVFEAELEVNTVRPSAVSPAPPTPTPVFERNGRFIVIGKPDFGFAGYTLSVALASPAVLSVVDATLNTAAGSVAAQARFATSDTRFSALVGMLPLVPGELDYGGAFRSRPTTSLSTMVGWLWVLTGPDTIVGFRPDSNVNASPEAVIYLPGDIAAQHQQGLPLSVSESTLLARAELFSDDPGSTCKPFSNPGRILGERRFRTVLRVTQPQVALAGATPIHFENQGARTVLFPRQSIGTGNPVDYEANPARFQAETVAFGHVLEQVVRYRSNGYSLGDVAHSLTLAPREKRRIMKVDFSRKERASRTEATRLEDEVGDTLDARRDYDDAVSGELSEWSRGTSQASAVGGAAGAAGIPGGAPVIMGGGISGGASQSSATQSSRRETAARESQALRDAIRRYGQSLRTLESTVVTELEQSETVTGVSEVVQNINYTRALSVLYYQILRHLRVDTEVTSVTECVFVPMPIRPFDDARISRHRRTLSRYARGWLEKSVFRYLDDIQAGFAGSEIPPGKRADAPLVRLSGTLTVTMGINMPVGGMAETSGGDSDTALHQTSRALEDAWKPYAHLLPMPVGVLAQTIAEQRGRPKETEKLFRAHLAPAMARAALERLTLSGSKVTLDSIDFTLVTAYKRREPLKVNFDVLLPSQSDLALPGQVTRRNLERLTLKLGADGSLPPGSWLNLIGATISYATEHYSSNATNADWKRDLIDPTTGKPDQDGALVEFPCSSDDNLDMRERLRQGYVELKKTLEANTFTYHKAIWRGIDSDELYALLDGYAFSETDGRSLASIIDRRLLGTLGNSLVFGTRTDTPLDPLFRSFTELTAHYVSGLPPADPIRISLPTSGLYARAHLDECIAAEEHDGSFDWVFNNQEPELSEFPDGMFNSRRAEAQGLSATTFPSTLINLQNAPAAPLPTGAGSTLQTLGTDAFRDLTGLAGTQANLTAAMNNATNLATSMAQAAVAAQAGQLTADARAGKDLSAFGAAIEKAITRGQLPSQAGQAALADMAARKGSGSNGQGGDDLHRSVLNGDGESSHTSVERDGTTKVTSKKPAPKQERDPVAAVSVVEIPGGENDQILFMNFDTGSANLKDEHVRYLEGLAGNVGVRIEHLEHMEGHTSTSGSADSNEDLGLERANALFDRLHRLVTPLGASPDYSPAFLSTAGEAGSYRARFAHIEQIGKAKGAGHPNDPVEKAVLFTLKAGVRLTKPLRYDLGGTEIMVINNYLFIGGKAYCSLKDEGPVKEIDRSTVEVLRHKVVNTEVRTGNNTIDVNVGPIALKPAINISITGNTILKDFALTFFRDPSSGVLGVPEVTEPIAKRKHSEWLLDFFAPRVEGERSLESVLLEVAKLIASSPTEPPNAPPMLREVIAEARRLNGQDPTAEKLKEFIVGKLSLGPLKTVLTDISFGQIVVSAEIALQSDHSVKVTGELRGPGLFIGTRGALPKAPILVSAPYTTKEPKLLSDWDNSPPFLEFSYLNNGLVAGALSTAQAFQQINSGLVKLLDMIIPLIPAQAAADKLADLIKEAMQQSVQFVDSQLRFKAFAGDAGISPIGPPAVATGLEYQIIAMAPNASSFVKGPQTP